MTWRENNHCEAIQNVDLYKITENSHFRSFSRNLIVIHLLM